MSRQGYLEMTVSGAWRARRWAVHRVSWGVALATLVLAVSAAGQDATSQIQSEVGRLQQSIKDKPISYPDAPNANAMAIDALKAALQEQSAGRPYLSLERLCQMSDFVYGAWFLMDKVEAVKSGLPAFEAEWEKASAGVNALDQKAETRDWSDARAAVQALSEAARGKTIPLLEGGRGFAVSTEPKDGLFHLGEAQGEAQFAAFAASLNLPRKGARYPFRSLLPELEALQQKANTAFQPPRSIDIHTQFMLLNSALKLAKELDASRSYAGALYQYLEAVLDYGMLDAAPVEASQQSTLKEALGAMHHKVDASERDESVAQLFLERAESRVAPLDGSAPSADDWKSANVIVHQVLPAYFAADRPLPSPGRASNKMIEITLVRWPYT